MVSAISDTTVHSETSPVLAPFMLADRSILKPIRLVREVPGKRQVFQAIWHDKPVYAKLFFGKQAEKYAQRDLEGIQQLLAARILTPEVLTYQVLTDQSAYVLVLKEISGAANAEQVWNALALGSSLRLQIATQLIREVAQHHKAGLQQTDLYLKNFLLQDDRVFTLDGDGIRPLPKHNEGQSALRNLAALLSKFDVLEIVKWLPQLLKTYGDARGWQTLPRLTLLQHLIAVHRCTVTNAYADKKVFRTCTDVQVHRSQGQFLAVVSAYRTVMDVQNALMFDQCLQVPAFKSGNTCTVGLLTASFGAKDAQKIVIKRYNVKSLWHGMMRSFRKTRAAASWSNAHRLRLLGVPAIQPVSLLEQRYFLNLLRGKSYFLSEYIEAPTVDIVFAAETDKAKRAELVKQLVEMFYRLYLLQISHGDMKASNIMIVDGKPLLIDLDSMQQHRFGLMAKHQHARDLRRFMRNWQHDEALSNAFKKVFKAVYADHQPLKLAHIH
ncbi:MAG: hypothetical protein CTY33_02265 [Methylotenera sp.]|nr:MAG: hypothetical protein CTY33_02265 [Methylotenera sp.]